MDCGPHTGIKLLEHAMKIMKRVLEARLRKQVVIDNMDSIFILRQHQEKYLPKKRELWFAFVDLENAFDRVQREVVWWALRYLGVENGLIQVIQSTCNDPTRTKPMLGWPTVFGHCHLCLKVGLYIPIEPEIAGPHNSQSDGDQAEIWQARVSFVRGHSCAKFRQDCSKFAYTFPYNPKFRAP